MDDAWSVEIAPADAYFIARLAKEAVESFPPRATDIRLPLRKRLDMYTGLSAEFALHWITGATWFAGLRLFGTPSDVGPYQVKGTRERDRHLLVPKDAPDGMPFLLAIVQGRGVRFVGWCDGGEAETRAVPRFHPNVPANLLWVPQDHLRPMASIDRSRLHGQRPSSSGPYSFLRQGFKGHLPGDSIRALAAILHEMPESAILRFEDWNQGFRSGMKVVHDTFGEGTIQRLTNRDGKASAYVMFDGGHLQELDLGSHEWGSINESEQARTNRRKAKEAKEKELPSGPALSPGTRVEHERFGTGTIQKVIRKKGVERVVVDFDEIGYKKLATHRHDFKKLDGP